MALCLIIPVANAQSKKLQKAREKECKAKIKEFTKEGWKVFGTTRSLEVALLTHYDKLNGMGDDGYEIVGLASKFKSKNVGHQQAFNTACVDYAGKANSAVKGRITSDVFGDGTDGEGEFDRFYGVYERLVQKEIKGELKESFSIIHDLGGGYFEMQTFFIVNEKEASKARLRAMEQAVRETEMAQKYARKVSEFVQEGFKDAE